MSVKVAIYNIKFTFVRNWGSHQCLDGDLDVKWDEESDGVPTRLAAECDDEIPTVIQSPFSCN